MAHDVAEERYLKRRAALMEYLMSALSVGDWHAVSDAANDLRVLEATRDAVKGAKR